MNSLLNQLKADHRQMEQVLAQLDIRRPTLSNNEINYSLELINELQHDLADEHHHREDTAIEFLRSHHHISDWLIDTLLQDHKRLDSKAAITTEMLNQLLDDDTAHTLVDINENLQGFIAAYRDHIRVEEEVIFPMVLELNGELRTSRHSTVESKENSV